MDMYKVENKATAEARPRPKLRCSIMTNSFFYYLNHQNHNSHILIYIYKVLCRGGASIEGSGSGCTSSVRHMGQLLGDFFPADVSHVDMLFFPKTWPHGSSTGTFCRCSLVKGKKREKKKKKKGFHAYMTILLVFLKVRYFGELVGRRWIFWLLTVGSVWWPRGEYSP